MTIDLDDTTPEPDISTVDGLMQELQNQAELLTEVATGGPRFEEVEAEYQHRRRRLVRVLEHRSIRYPFPWFSLKEWHGYYKENLPTYASRRVHISLLIGPVLDALDSQQSDLDEQEPEIPTTRSPEKIVVQNMNKPAVESLEFSGKSVDDAIQHALQRLQKHREEVDITILQESGKRLVGRSLSVGMNARIRVTILPPRPITIVYCYAHEDRELRDRIDKHLGVLKRLGQVAGWYDREIQAGTEWEREIEEHLSTASIILLLVSADFVNSDYCYGVEMQKALTMHEEGTARVLPILLRPVDWQDAPFAKLQVLPTGAKPITSWPDPEQALEDVARQIRSVVSTLRTRRS